MSFNHAPDNVDGEAGWTLTHEALLSLRVTASELDQRSRQQVVSLGCAGRRRRGCRGGRAKTKHNHSTGIPVDVDRRPNGHPAASTDCIRQLTLVTVTEHPSLPRYPGHRAGRPRCPVPSLRPVGNGAYDISHTPTECSGRGHRCYQRHQPESLHSSSNLTVINCRTDSDCSRSSYQPLSCCVVNACSLKKPNALHLLTTEICSHEVDVAAVTETWLNKNIASSDLTVACYRLYR